MRWGYGDAEYIIMNFRVASSYTTPRLYERGNGGYMYKTLSGIKYYARARIILPYPNNLLIR